MSLRSRLGSLRAATLIRFRTGGALSRRVYYAFMSSAFGRERALVGAGHREYLKRKSAGRLEFLLRRNIHMMEKGLTMRPRRDTFALAYVEETVELAARILDARPAIIAPDVEAWAREVLEQFFEATASSSADEIRRARAAFADVSWSVERRSASGPEVPVTGPPPVDIDGFLALTQRRKSVRWFKPDVAVDRSAIDLAVRAASEAPSACNRQPFTFRIFDDPERVQRVAKIPMGTAGYGQNLPALAVVVGDQSAFIDERDRHLIYIDGALASMSFVHALEAQGVSSVCINWPDIAARDKRMAAELGLAPHERVVMLIGFGYADDIGLVPHSAKRSLDSMRSYNA